MQLGRHGVAIAAAVIAIAFAVAAALSPNGGFLFVSSALSLCVAVVLFVRGRRDQDGSATSLIAGRRYGISERSARSLWVGLLFPAFAIPVCLAGLASDQTARQPLLVAILLAIAVYSVVFSVSALRRTTEVIVGADSATASDALGRRRSLAWSEIAQIRLRRATWSDFSRHVELRSVNGARIRISEMVGTRSDLRFTEWDALVGDIRARSSNAEVFVDGKKV